jgi:thiosulfate reductase cytochrome b subunit
VRLTHWLTLVAFLALLVTGLGITISHPRFYWGEVGNVNTRPLFVIPIPASRATVPTGYNYQLPDQNGWGRYLHFEAAWLLVLTGLVYGAYGLSSGHFRKNLIPARHERTLRALTQRIAAYARGAFTLPKEGSSYNVLQRTTYLIVIFIVFPLMIWTGLAMSPSFTSVLPATAALLGGRQSARTIHFFLTGFLLLFLFVHVTMVALSGFRSRMRAMITGYAQTPEPDSKSNLEPNLESNLEPDMEPTSEPDMEKVQ